VLSLTGDDAITSMYGTSYTTGWVDTNGLVSFVNPGTSSADAWPIPSVAGPGEPNAAVYPFWHDWVVDTNASVRTTTTGSAPNRQLVIEWRNVYSYEDPNTRVSFEVIFDEAGGFSFAYADQEATFLELGGGATVGIEKFRFTPRKPPVLSRAPSKARGAAGPVVAGT
jgi:hypothetical protein